MEINTHTQLLVSKGAFMSKILINQDSLKQRREYTRFAINQGSNIYRILPPHGDVEVHNNYPYKKWNVVWLTDPTTGRRRPYATPYTNGESKCPVIEYQALLKKRIETMAKQIETSDDDDAVNDLDARLKGLKEIQWQLNVNTTYVYNAADKSGKIGLLELKATAHKELKKRMSEYINEYGQDPTSLSNEKDDAGVWFNFKKEGEKKETEYHVEINQVRVKDKDGDISKKDDRTALSDNIKENFDSLAYDLQGLYQVKSYEALKELLVAQLLILVDDNPDLEFEEFPIKKKVQVKPVVEKKAETKSTVKPANKVTLKVDVDDDEDEIVYEEEAPKASAKKATPVANKVKKTMDDDDIMNLADDILKD
jgi:hypothetical protein